MSTYPGHEKAAPATFGDSTGTADSQEPGSGTGFVQNIAAAALAVAIVALPAVTNLLANALIGPEF